MLSALTALLVAAASWGVSTSKIERLTQEAANANIRAERVEDRVRALETNRTLEREVADLRKEVAMLNTQIGYLRDEIRRRKR